MVPGILGGLQSMRKSHKIKADIVSENLRNDSLNIHIKEKLSVAIST